MTPATRARGRYVALRRHRDADDPEVLDAARALAIARAEARIAAEIVSAPPLPTSSRDRLIELLRTTDSVDEV